MEFIDLKRQYNLIKDDLQRQFLKIMENTSFLMGEEVDELEKKLASYVGVKHAVTCASGSDALIVALRALGVGRGDGIFVPSHSFFASADAICIVGATPIFVDLQEETCQMDPQDLKEKIQLAKTQGELTLKGIIAVDFYGLPAPYDEIKSIAEAEGLFIVEDASRGFGGSIREKKACAFGDVAITSFFPTHPLGCYGDGGCLFTNDDTMEKVLRSIVMCGKDARTHEHVRPGLSSRLDTLQAAVLLLKMDLFEKELDMRNIIADKYREMLQDNFEVPIIPEGYISSYAQFILKTAPEKRDHILEYAHAQKVPLKTFHAYPVHLSSVYGGTKDSLPVTENLCRRALSIPMHPYLTSDELQRVVDVLNTAVRNTNE